MYAQEYRAFKTLMHTTCVLISFNPIVVDCTDLSGKKLLRQVGMGSVLTQGWLGSVIVSTLIQNAREVGTIPALGTVFPIFITPMTLGCRVHDVMYSSRTDPVCCVS